MREKTIESEGSCYIFYGRITLRNSLKELWRKENVYIRHD